jgi:hypothetical protein
MDQPNRRIGTSGWNGEASGVFQIRTRGGNILVDVPECRDKALERKAGLASTIR